MSERQIAPFGTWKSPITSELLSAECINFQGVAAHEATGNIYLLEGRPAENGRSCVVEHSNNGSKDALPLGCNARSAVHEMGGGSFTVSQKDGTLIFTDWDTRGVFRCSPDSAGRKAIVDADPDFRYADFNVHPTNPDWILAVKQDHHSSVVQNSLVAINGATRKVQTIAEGADFYAHPQFSPDGLQVCWTQWNHPDMPWTGTELYTASWHGHGAPLKALTAIAGKAGVESVSQPRWGLDGSLFFASDQTGYWQLYQMRNGTYEVRAIKLKGLEDAEFAGPEWLLASCTYIPLDASTLAAAYTRNANNRLIIIDITTDTYSDPELLLNDIRNEAMARVSDTKFVVIGSTATAPNALYLIDLQHPSEPQVLKSSADLGLSTSLYSEAEHICFPRVYGVKKDGLGHALYLPPKNPGYQAPEGALPPLIIGLHGGPTGHEAPGLSLMSQYWISRGYAFADVNYAGSSGYGRAYRDRLNGQWGIADIADAASCVAHLASTSRIDSSRIGIRGGSAGGYGVLQALCVYPDIWAGGVSLYGISGLKALIQDTHKFESHYNFALIFDDGTSEEEKENIYRERSPYYHADKIRAPVLLLQGSEDKIVPPNQRETWRGRSKRRVAMSKLSSLKERDMGSDKGKT